MSDIKTAYGSSGQAITITLASLSDAAIRESNAVDNSANKYLDAIVIVKVTTGVSGGDGGDVIPVYVAGTADGGTSYSGEATGADGVIASVRNLPMLGIIQADAATTTLYKVFTVAAAFGGVMPDHWSIVIQNSTGSTLDVDSADHFVKYQGVYATVT